MAQLRLEAATEEEIRVLAEEIGTAVVVEDLRVWRGRKGTPPAWLGYAHVRLMDPNEPATPALARRTARPDAEESAAARPTRVTSPRRRAAR
jgi:hypothetical protein